jgi:hypothetical protein
MMPGLSPTVMAIAFVLDDGGLAGLVPCTVVSRLASKINKSC